MVALSGRERTAILVGGVYFLIYLTSSYASRNAGRMSRKIGHMEKTLNLTFIAGSALLAMAGGAIGAGIPGIAIIFFLLFFLLQNARRPVNITYLSEKISHRTMASGLSAESQIKTLLMAILAPVIGFLADRFGIGSALIAAGAVMGILSVGVWLHKNRI